MTARPSQWLAMALVTVFAAGLVTAGGATPATAAPGGSSNSSEADEKEDNPMLNDVLSSAGRRYLEAKSAVTKSTKAQAALNAKIKAAEKERDALLPEVGAVASQQYRTGGITTAAFLLQANTPGSFMEKAVSLNEINTLNNHKLKAYADAIREVTESKTQLATEIAEQKQNLTVMSKQKTSAESALALVGGKSVTGGFVTLKSAKASPAPRNSDGGFSPEGCTEKDPTTSGCITKRTLHMYQEVRKAGFKRFVGCHRNGGPFEHPKGRACDWSLQNSGFAPWHNQDTREYGNNLMAFIVRNAEALGILYVIWNKQIWWTGDPRGWHSYSGPSDHTDHVHVSMV
jgi:peptidoglycan DL-endopeptidase CwlO